MFLPCSQTETHTHTHTHTIFSENNKITNKIQLHIDISIHSYIIYILHRMTGKKYLFTWRAFSSLLITLL
jgi:hypothetical protein